MRRFLVVDDNLAFAENLAEIIADAGVGEVEIAQSGARALTLIAATRFDAMLTDMRMPKMSGAELIRQARALDPELPVVVVSAFSADEQLTTVVNEGVLSVLPKPVPIARVLDLIGRARRGGVVAVVEDDAALADNLVEALRERGFASIIARSLAETERLAGAMCVALVDLRVPGGGDGAAMALVADRFPDLPLLVVTAYRGQVAVPADVAIFDKPFDTGRLLDAIENICARRRSSA
jgi:two-component system, response regulator PdtaR